MAKKKAKRKQRKKRSTRRQATGKKYRSDKFVPYIMQAEIGIHEAATMRPEINDAVVRSVIHHLIAQLRRGGTITAGPSVGGTAVDLIEWRIKGNLTQAFQEYGHISNADVIGCLRVVLGSIDTWSGPPLGPRGYLGYLAGFMEKLGVDVRLLSEQETIAMGLEEAPELPPDYDPDSMTLEELGRFWLEHDEEFIELLDDFSNRARSTIQLGQAEEAVQVCRTLLDEASMEDQEAELHYLIGVGLRHLGQFDDSIEALQEAIGLQDGFVGAMHELAETHFAAGDYQTALDTWRRELDEAPENFLSWLDIARAYRALGDDQSEEQSLRRYIEHRADSVQALALLVDCLRRQGQDGEARMVAYRVVNALPGGHAGFEDWAHWVRLKLEARDPQEALRALKTQEGREQRSSWTHLLKAIVYEQTGDQAASRRELSRAWEQIPSPVVRQQLLAVIDEVFPSHRLDRSGAERALEEQPESRGVLGRLLGRLDPSR